MFSSEVPSAVSTAIHGCPLVSTARFLNANPNTHRTHARTVRIIRVIRGRHHTRTKLHIYTARTPSNPVSTSTRERERNGCGEDSKKNSSLSRAHRHRATHPAPTRHRRYQSRGNRARRRTRHRSASMTSRRARVPPQRRARPSGPGRRVWITYG